MFIQAFSEGTVLTFDYGLIEKAPFTIQNSLGIPLIVQHSANLYVADSSSRGRVHEVEANDFVELQYSVFESSTRGKLSTLQRQESCLFNISIGNFIDSLLLLLVHYI